MWTWKLIITVSPISTVRFNSGDTSHSPFFSNCVSQSVIYSAARSSSTKKRQPVFALFLFVKKKNIRIPIWKRRRAPRHAAPRRTGLVHAGSWSNSTTKDLCVFRIPFFIIMSRLYQIIFGPLLTNLLNNASLLFIYVPIYNVVNSAIECNNN